MIISNRRMVTSNTHEGLCVSYSGNLRLGFRNGGEYGCGLNAHPTNEAPQATTSRVAKSGWQTGSQAGCICRKNCQLNFYFGAFPTGIKCKIAEGETGQFTAPGHGLSSREGLITPLLYDKSSGSLTGSRMVEQMTSSVVQRSCEYDNGDFSVSFSSIGLELETLCSHIVSKSSCTHLSPVLLEPSCLIESVRGLATPEHNEEMLSRYAPKNFYFLSFSDPTLAQTAASGRID